MFDPKFFKLGKKAPKLDAKRLQLSKVSNLLPVPPPSLSWYKNITSFGMMLNDTLGDCTCAAYGHGAQVARLNSTGLITPPDNLIESLYEKSCGYVPGDPSTDQGGVIVDVLNYARSNAPWLKKRKWLEKGHKHPYQLLLYSDPSPQNETHIMQSIATFGVVDIGLQLPITAQAQVGGVWDVVGDGNTGNSAPGSWGGHSVVCSAYDSTGITCITWGALQKMTWKFWNRYCDEAHALLYRAWVESFSNNYPAALAQLEADLKQVTN